MSEVQTITESSISGTVPKKKRSWRTIFRQRLYVRLNKLVNGAIEIRSDEDARGIGEGQADLERWIDGQVGEAHSIGFKVGFDAGVVAAKLETMQHPPGGKEGE